MCVSLWITTAPSIYSCGRLPLNRATKTMNIPDEKSKPIMQKSSISAHRGTPAKPASPNKHGKAKDKPSDDKVKSATYGKKSPHKSLDLAKTQENDLDLKKLLKREHAETPAKEICEYEKKAADEGIVLQPRLVKYLGNIDDITQERRAQIEKDVESIKSDKEKSAEKLSNHGVKMKVRINEKNCVLYETKDAPTLDEQDENEDPAAVDLY